MVRDSGGKLGKGQGGGGDGDGGSGEVVVMKVAEVAPVEVDEDPGREAR